jgi:hypothetical protein
VGSLGRLSVHTIKKGFIMDSPEKRIAEAAGIVDVGDAIWWTDATQAGDLFGDILYYAREWKWGKVEKLLDKLYTLVGAENPSTGYAFHIGEHPLQVYIRSTRDYTN